MLARLKLYITIILLKYNIFKTGIYNLFYKIYGCDVKNYLLELPPDMIGEILSYCTGQEIYYLSLVNKAFNRNATIRKYINVEHKSYLACMSWKLNQYIMFINQLHHNNNIYNKLMHHY